MLTVGGNNTNTLDCDWELKGVAVWDMSTLKWDSIFRTDLPDYQVPSRVLGLTGGTENGHATVKDPALGWTDQGLKAVFATSRRSENRAENTIAPASSPKKNHTAAIAGGVGGGIVGLLAFLGIVSFFCSRRQSKRQSKNQGQELHSDTTNLQRKYATEKDGHQLQAELRAENDPAELASSGPQELGSRRQVIEADTRSTSTIRAELPGTNTSPSGLEEDPTVRTLGDDLPERV